MVPYDETTYFHEPFVLFGYLAAVTTSIELATGVVILPERQTALVAKQAAEVALLSDERLRLGVGVGWNYVEYEGLNEDFSTRGARQEEQIDVLRRLWKDPIVDYRGRFHTIDRLGVLPRPRSTIPIWLGGFSEAVYRRAARVADGFLYSLIGTAGPENDPRGTVMHLRDLVEAQGRDPSDFGIDLIVPVAVEPGEPRAWSSSGGARASRIRTRPASSCDAGRHDRAALALSARARLNDPIEACGPFDQREDGIVGSRSRCSRWLRRPTGGVLMAEKLSPAAVALKHSFETGDRSHWEGALRSGVRELAQQRPAVRVPAAGFGGAGALQTLLADCSCEVIQDVAFEEGALLRIVVRGTVRANASPTKRTTQSSWRPATAGIVRIDDYVDPSFGSQLVPDAG